MEHNVLCAASSYDQKYYLSPAFAGLPTQIKEELQILCVLFTEDVGGILLIVYDEEGNLYLQTRHDEGDLLYDDIGAELKIKEIQRTRGEFLESLELYCRAVVLELDTDII